MPAAGPGRRVRQEQERKRRVPTPSPCASDAAGAAHAARLTWRRLLTGAPLRQVDIRRSRLHDAAEGAAAARARRTARDNHRAGLIKGLWLGEAAVGGVPARQDLRVEVDPELVAVDVGAPPAAAAGPRPDAPKLRGARQIPQPHLVVAHLWEAVNDAVNDVVGVGAFACAM